MFRSGPPRRQQASLQKPAAMANRGFSPGTGVPTSAGVGAWGGAAIVAQVEREVAEYERGLLRELENELNQEANRQESALSHPSAAP